MPVQQLTSELIENYTKAGAWQERPLYAAFDEVAARVPDVVAVADQHEELTYAELKRRSENLAAWLLQQGLRPGAPVGIQCANRVALAVVHLACDRADLLYVPLSVGWRKAEMAHLLSVSQTELLIVSAPVKGFDYLAMIDELRPTLPHLRLVGGMDGAKAEFDYDAVCRQDRSLSPPERDPNAPRYIMVTSGTTGLPHMSLWSDNNLWYFMCEHIDAVRLGVGDVAVGIAPASTGATGYVFAVLGPILAGATSILLEDWTPQNALDLFVAAKATHITAIPTQVLKLLNDPTLRGRDFTSIRTFTNAGAAMPPEAAATMEEVFDCLAHVCFGATDGGVPTMLRWDDPRPKRLATVGRVIAHSELRLVDADMNDVPVGEPGEVLWRGATKSFGYLNEPERTEAAFWGDGWYRSGDIGSMDADGYLSVVGRVKDLIIRGGQNISPREIEDFIVAQPEVADVSVIGIPDAVLGERVCACVVLLPGKALGLAELTERMRAQGMATFKLPERIEIFDDFPKSAGGKVTKVELRSIVADRSGGSSEAP
jgi:non-ribosomal peptide synthetase component E (peptide arylation enzyme)